VVGLRCDNFKIKNMERRDWGGVLIISPLIIAPAIRIIFFEHESFLSLPNITITLYMVASFILGINLMNRKENYENYNTLKNENDSEELMIIATKEELTTKQIYSINPKMRLAMGLILRRAKQEPNANIEAIEYNIWAIEESGVEIPELPNNFSENK
jgi:hypothetical protein